jgi:hypothetical protein
MDDGDDDENNSPNLTHSTPIKEAHHHGPTSRPTGPYPRC